MKRRLLGGGHARLGVPAAPARQPLAGAEVMLPPPAGRRGALGHGAGAGGRPLLHTAAQCRTALGCIARFATPLAAGGAAPPSLAGPEGDHQA